MRKVLCAVLVVGAIAAAYILGRASAGHMVNASTTRRVLYYVDPMHPAYKSDKPGIAPDCGMQLEPVYADDAANASPATMAQSPLGTVSIDGATQQLLGISTATVERSGGTRVLRVLGRVVPEDTRVYKVDSGADGFVRETYNDSVGVLVKKDQKLATYYSADSLSIASGFLAATERVPGATGNDGSRTMPFPGALSKQGFNSVRGYTDRLRNLGMSDAQIKQMADSLQLPESVDVVAPVNGFILTRSITAGQHFDRSAEFYRIADLSRVWIIAEVFESEAQYFRPGSVARVSLPGQRKARPARITNDLPQVDPVTRTLKLRLEADNPGYALRPDMFVDLELPVTEPSGLTVPADALIDFGLKKRAFVDHGNGVFEPRDVETGWEFGDRVQIVKGLSAGERVVASGTFLLDSESKLRAAAGGMTKPPRTEENRHDAMLLPEQRTGSGGGEMSAPQLMLAKTRSMTAVDPKCGMKLDSAKSVTSGNTLHYRGRTYYFCSKTCKEDFEKDPGRYLMATHSWVSHDGAGQ